MMIDTTQEDRIATLGGEIRVTFLAFEDDHVSQVALCDLRTQLGEFFCIDFGGEDFSSSAYNLRRSKGESAVTGADIGHDGSWFPVHKRGEALHFVGGIGIGTAD
jgi:hypothetical protein